MSIKKEFFPSMIGVAITADILPDLPLPSCPPTPLETSIISCKTDLKSETLRLLNNSDSQLCSQITKALASVDTSFLKLKVTPTNSSYKVFKSETTPPLIKTLLRASALSPQPKLQLKRIDTRRLSLTRSPANTEPSTPVGQGPTHPISTTPTPARNLKQSRGRTSSSDVTSDLQTSSRKRKKREEDGGEEERKVKKIKKRQPLNELKQKEEEREKEDRDQLVVSIDISKKGLSLKGKRKSSNNENIKKKRKLLSSSSSDGDFVVSIPRRKLKPSLISPPPLSPVLSPPQFTLAPNVHDAPHEKRKEKKLKKKKKSIKDPAHLAHLKHYTELVKPLLEIEESGIDKYYPKGVVSQLLSETVRIKQVGVLHEVKPDLLIRLISVMDKHVLDTASLLLSTEPPEGEELSQWREQVKDRLLRSLDASLIILQITTTRNIPTQVQIEESIDQVINHTGFHLKNNIYPEFDPVYRNDSSKDGSLPRQKRRYISTSATANNKTLMSVYHRLVEIISNLAQLLNLQKLTDMTVLKLSSLGIFPFFVENVSSLQLSALKLVRTIFSRYDKHRELILEDIFASLGRLPTTKRTLRSFRLSDGQCIQMVTALILQLVQCMVIAPPTEATPTSNKLANNKESSYDVIMINSYEVAMRTASNFLSTLLKKCCSNKVEDDFRSLFDNFVHDLLTTLSLPEWPASEVLLTLLGVLLVQSFSNRSNDLQLRLTSLDHLGVIASRLRKDAITSIKEEHEEIIDILSQIMQLKLEGVSPLPSPTGTSRLDAFSENACYLRKALIAFLIKQSEIDSSSNYAKDFYIGQWLRDNQLELEKTLANPNTSDSPPSPSLNDQLYDTSSLPTSSKAVYYSEKIKDILTDLIKPLPRSVVMSLSSTLDEKKATLVTRYLSSERALNKSFDSYLHQLLRVLSEPAVHVRTRAMKALSTIVAADPNILSKSELQRAVQKRFSDSSTLMREAAVDLVGRFVLVQPALTPQYYSMLLERILDTGVSVRKRVIKILKDICINQPEFNKVPDICIKMLHRINDEEGIKQLVTGIFYQLWFTVPSPSVDQIALNITKVVSNSPSEQECFESLLQELLKNTELYPSVMKASELMINSLIEQLLSLDEQSEHKTTQELVNCMTTLYRFSNIRASFLIGHAHTLLPYLSSQCRTEEDVLLVHYSACILKSVVPLLTRPSETFLSTLQEELIKHIMIQGPIIVQSCVSCLSEVVNKVSKQYSLVGECFNKFHLYLEKSWLLYVQNPKSPQLVAKKPSMLRSLFTVGLFCKDFDMDFICKKKDSGEGSERISDKVYRLFVFFCNTSDEEMRIKALLGLGYLCVRYPEMMLNKEAKELYMSCLSSEAPLKMKCQVIKNIQNHLLELESIMKAADASRLTDKEGDSNLMELGDQHSSVSSNIAQLYLQSILESHNTHDIQVRFMATQTILLILRQGLVHPGLCVPFLITLTTDPEEQVKTKAESQLNEYSTRFGGFMQTHLSAGLKKVYNFQLLLTSPSIPRGHNGVSSLLSHLYSLVRSSKPQRRVLLQTLLRPFEDYETHPLGMLLFLADTISSLPYTVYEEPLFVLHNIDMTISVTGANILQSFKEVFNKSGVTGNEEEEERDELEQLSQHNYDLVQLNNCCKSSLGCVLLLLLKQHIKNVFNLNDKKCQEYSTSDNNKQWDKTIPSRKQGLSYEPTPVINEVEREAMGKSTQHGKEECLKLYLHFKNLMNRLDTFELDDEDTERELLVPPILMSSEQQQEQFEKTPPPVTPTNRQRARSRTSSTSSVTSKKGKKIKKKLKRKKIRIDSDDSDDSFEA